MYDPFARGIIENLPDLADLTSDGTRRALSRTYFDLINLRLRGSQEISNDTVRDVLFLRRLANTLESRAVFDTDVEPDEGRASAFVAAEALSLLASLREALGVASGNGARIEREEIFSRVEAALLYIVAGYDANAGGAVRQIPPNTIEPDGNLYSRARFYASEWTLDVLIGFCKFHLNPLPSAVCPVDFVGDSPASLLDLEHDVRGRLYAKLGETARAHMGWLTGEVPEGLATAREQFTQIAQRLAETQHPTYADIHHLARLLLAVLESTKGRSLLHVVPLPESEDPDEYRAYLHVRSSGPKGGSGRPLLWPSVQKYVAECLPGPSRHAVVSMPTGSGKSFLAELAASQALLNGWVLYLVPTNALAHQVRRDLKRDLKPLDAEVLAFVGAGEYTTLEGERVEHIPARAVAVMTPEKCSLAMRLNPEVFRSCSLCVFDECQLIGEKSRGVIAELVLSQLMALVPDCHFLLMSAIVQNPGTLADWLHEATGGESLPVPLNWRPTRSLRCAVGVDAGAARAKSALAKQELESKNPFYKNQKFEANFALLAGLQGAWQTNDELDYASAILPRNALLRVHREPVDGGWNRRIEAVSWVNESSRRIGEMLAETRIPTLVFLPASRHYPFSVGGKITLSSELCAELREPSERVLAFLTLAEDELGLPSEVGNLIERGVSVHTAALLETEKFAAEESFLDSTTKLMLATGTLAQGLNLPAIAVVIGGTQIGYSPGEDPEIVARHKLSQFLNAAGRSGRAGFANQGLVLAVPDSMIYFQGPQEAPQVINEVAYLAEADASVRILSSLEPFMDSIATGQFDADRASPEELVAAAMLVGGSPEAPSAVEVLHRTYAAYLRRQSGLDDGAGVGAERLAEVRTEFVAESGAPEWLPVAAQRAGLSFFTTLRLFQAWTRVIPQLSPGIFEWDTWLWVSTFFQALRYLTPKQISDTFGIRNLERFMPDLHAVVIRPSYARDNPAWTPSESWMLGWQRIETLVKSWMYGKPIKDIASELLDLSADDISSQRDHGGAPIPKTLGFLNEIIDRHLAMLAGGIVAIVEEELSARRQAGEDWPSHLPFELLTLPLSLKYGCDSPQTLAWYRFGLRFRRPAHLLRQAFPPDPAIQDDNMLSEVVQDLRRKWLRGELPVPQPLRDEYGPVFDAIKVIIE